MESTHADDVVDDYDQSPRPQPLDKPTHRTANHDSLEGELVAVDEARHTRLSVKPTALTRNRSSSFPLRGIQDLTGISGLEGASGTIRRKSTLPSLKLTGEAQPGAAKLSPTQIYELISSPESIPVRPISPVQDDFKTLAEIQGNTNGVKNAGQAIKRKQDQVYEKAQMTNGPVSAGLPHRLERQLLNGRPIDDARTAASTPTDARPKPPFRSMSIPLTTTQNRSASEYSPREAPTPLARLQYRQRRELASTPKAIPESLDFPDAKMEPAPPLVPTSIPLPPFSLPTYLQLELSSQRPSPLYIHRPDTSDIPYESSRVKFQRLLNFLLLPPHLEQTLLFGALTCLDSWLYTFTVLPLRFCGSFWILGVWCGRHVFRELQDVAGSARDGIGQMLDKYGLPHLLGKKFCESSAEDFEQVESARSASRDAVRPRRNKHKRQAQSVIPASTLQHNHKADLLQGFLIIVSCTILTRFDASRMYHNIRGQAAIKLYVIYNVLEVCDRLFSALGQDILECLFSRETLESDGDGQSKILRPLWMFLLALVYTVIHSTALFYQVITLNVAVNSYSNALLTLLMSNQFVEIKGTVFKRFEKENLFQLTCADIVERFQLWLMLLVIGLRNIVEVGGLSIGTGSFLFSGPSSSTSSTAQQTPPNPNITNPTTSTFSMSILPDAFTVLPTLVPFQVLSPFLLVLGSEMLVDWLKHAYITKFNATSPRIYSRFLDILCRDYYSHAFVDQNLTRRLGLPVIPLACLFIRAALQTYHMFLATNIAAPSLFSTTTGLAVDPGTPSEPTSSPILAQIDAVLRRALGHSSFGGGTGSSPSTPGNHMGLVWTWTLDDAIALATMLLFFLALYVVLLALKLALGMVLLSFARTRYSGMKAREGERMSEPGTMRLGGWGVTEVGEERRKTIYDEAPQELARLREREAKVRAKEKAGISGGGEGSVGLDRVERYEMVGKRIW